jgi:hypothetical protein
LLAMTERGFATEEARFFLYEKENMC